MLTVGREREMVGRVLGGWGGGGKKGRDRETVGRGGSGGGRGGMGGVASLVG